MRIRSDQFGGFLVMKGLIDEEKLERALSIQRVVPEKLGQHFVREGYLSEEQMLQALADFSQVPLLQQEDAKPDPREVRQIPEAVARRAAVVPLWRGEGNELLLACQGPVPRSLLQSISRLARGPVKLVLVPDRQLRKLQQAAYTRGVDTKIDFRSQTFDTEDINVIVEILEKLLIRAIAQSRSVSDMHFEPEKGGFLVRFREDGMLRRVESLSLALGEKLISRIKVLANLDIAEHRAPQDGSFAFKPTRIPVQIEPVNIRVSVLPVIYGEKAVMRVLPPHDEKVSLDRLGMVPETLERFKQILRLPHGLILVTGPTGSGKSTTLYGALQMLRSVTHNISTLEDPVELTLQGVNQTQVDNTERLDFAAGLRSILRQDPDIIMVGEIRDQDTLRTSLRASITGHLVLSTLHTNDAPTAFNRMLDMGGEPFLVAQSVRVVLAQRLVRMVCPYCLQPHPVTRAELDLLGLREAEPGSFSVQRGSGCDECLGTGYSGRLGLFEILVMDEEIRTLVSRRETPHQLALAARANGNYRSLFEDAVEKVQAGLTTPEEVLRVTIE
jgi:type IV pilus assembly protein PilB